MQFPLQSSMSVNIPQPRKNSTTNIVIPIPSSTDAFKNWTKDVNDILDKIRINSIILSNEHKKTYFILAARIKWFRIPVIFLSAIGSIFGIGLGPYMAQTFLSALCSVLSMIVGLIGSLELFLAISNKMENELVQSKELYLLAIEIQKTLLLNVENRNGDGTTYLEDKFNIYSKLIEKSYLLECKIMDELTPLPTNYRSNSNIQQIEKQKKSLRNSLNSYIPFQKSIQESNTDVQKTEENHSEFLQQLTVPMSSLGMNLFPPTVEIEEKPSASASGFPAIHRTFREPHSVSFIHNNNNNESWSEDWRSQRMPSTTNFKGGSASAQRGEVWSPEEYGYLLFPKETKL